MSIVIYDSICNGELTSDCFLFLEVHSFWEVPYVAHFCSLFRTAFNLSDFDIEVSIFFFCKFYYQYCL